MIPPGAFRPGPAARAGAGFATLFTGLFLALGAHLAFLPLWLEDQGLTETEIGALVAFGIAVRIVAGAALPALADRFAAQREAMALLGAAGALGTLAFFVSGAGWGLYLASGVVAAVLAGLIPLSDAAAYAAAERRGFSYAKVRSAGSFAFLAATFLVGGVVSAVGSDAVIWWMAAALALAGAAAFVMSRSQRRAPSAADRDPSAAAADRPELRRTLATLLTNRRFLIFLAAVGAVNASHAVYYVYGSVHWRSLGYSETLIGALWAWGVLAEIALFFYGRGLLARLGPERALMLAGAAGALRWSATALDPALIPLIALQTLHALTFGLMHLASIAFIARAAPPGAAASAQGLMSASAGGVVMLAATALAAWTYPAFGAGAYAFAAGFGLLGLALAAVLRAVRPPAAPDPI